MWTWRLLKGLRWAWWIKNVFNMWSHHIREEEFLHEFVQEKMSGRSVREWKILEDRKHGNHVKMSREEVRGVCILKGVMWQLQDSAD